MLIQQKVVLPYAMSSNNRIVRNNLQNLSLNPSVPWFLKCECERKGQKEGRGKDDPAVPCRAGTVIHAPQAVSCSDNDGSRSHSSQDVLPHSVHAWEVCLGHRGHTAFRDAAGTQGGDARFEAPTPLKLQGFPRGQQQPELSCCDPSPHQHWMLPSSLAPAISLKEDPEGAPNICVL